MAEAIGTSSAVAGEFGRRFLQNYIRAFPESVHKDLAMASTPGVDQRDPIRVMRRKLRQLFEQEVVAMARVVRAAAREGALAEVRHAIWCS